MPNEKVWHLGSSIEALYNINIVCFTVQQWKDVVQHKEDKMKLYCRSSRLNPLALNWLLTTQVKVK